MNQAALRRAAHHLDALIFIVLLALLPLFAIPYGSVHRTWEALFECVIFGLGVLWIIEGLFMGKWTLSGYRLLGPLIALIVFALLQTIPSGWGVGTRRALSVAPYETQRWAVKLFSLTLAGMLLLRYISNPRRFNALIRIVIGVGVATALFGLIRHMGLGNAPNFLFSQLDPDRSYAQFIDRNHFAFFIEMVLGLVLGLLVARGFQFGRRLIYLAAALLFCSSLALSNSRGGIFAMLCQLVFVAVLFGAARSARNRQGHRNAIVRGKVRQTANLLIVRGAAIALLLILVTAGVVWVGGDELSQRMRTVPREFRATSDDTRMNARRIEIWQTTWRLIKAHPIVGTGFGSFSVAFPHYHDASGPFTSKELELRPQAAHNEYLELLASGGLIGGALGVWFIIALLKTARENLQRSQDPFRRAVRVGSLCGLFGVGVHSLVDFGLHDTVNALLFTALVVIVASTIDDLSIATPQCFGT